MTKEPPQGGFEQDVLTGWRNLYCYTQRPKVCKKAKRQNNRRARRKARIVPQEGLVWD